MMMMMMTMQNYSQCSLHFRRNHHHSRLV